MRPQLSFGSLSLCFILSACDVGGGGSSLLPDGGAAPPPGNIDCVPPGTKGNSLDVGKYCTKGGHECNLFAFAKFCTLDFKDNVPGFCTTSCSADADCGDGAQCAASTDGSGQKGCTPIACLGPPKTGGSPDMTPPSSSSPDAGTMDQCAALARCCAAPGFPEKSLSTCQKSVATTAVWCEVVRTTYELEGDCPKAQ